MSRTGDDAVLMLDFVSRLDARDRSDLAPPTKSFRDASRRVAGLRVAFRPDLYASASSWTAAPFI
jgi:Asp-tRNA(Asn)/Glu-tRNA(Gln) amidotransferase A subunit family amidase